MKQRLLFSTMALALISGGGAPAWSLDDAKARTMPPQQQGFCRTADPLPTIGAENEQQQRPEPRPMGSTRGKGAVSAPPPAEDYSGGGEGDEIAVTGSRREEVLMDVPVAVTSISSETLEESDGEAAADARDGGYAPPPPPPPSPPPPVMVAPPAAAKVSGDTARGIYSPSEPSPSTTPYPYPEPRPYPRPQAGTLTAGEHDDLLNPELYARYVRTSNLAQTIPDLPRVDTSRTLTVKVTDSNGQPVPFADVRVACSDGNAINMATQADGTAVFFPGLDRLSPDVSVTVTRAGLRATAPRRVAVNEGAGSQQIGITTGPTAIGAKKLDLTLVVDTTGSMGDEIRYLQSELQAILSSVESRHRDLDIRVGFVFYRDEGDEYVTRTIGFDRDFGRAQGVLARQVATGGGDYPEAMDQALIRAMNLDWRADAVKSLILVADAPPHNDKFGRTWKAAEVARAKRIHITPLAASGVAGEAEYGMRAMAALTQSRYLFLTDDSGVGNPHAPPAIDCYLVTRLDALVRRVIDSQISGRRIEPDDGEIIRSVGKYDAGKCILPSGFDSQS